jgi:hypothetical protein
MKVCLLAWIVSHSIKLGFACPAAVISTYPSAVILPIVGSYRALATCPDSTVLDMRVMFQGYLERGFVAVDGDGETLKNMRPSVIKSWRRKRLSAGKRSKVAVGSIIR